ncbi:hypothetical protein B0J11DRAFT_320439 [Dendryphion nanum]|uniref:Yeast cell wall synthesis Kre9/Knh1-like N-terminal domain-containing protein n=1 Tax=Dendryphion nanum TaxID=256645 RepID=A0A9P9ILP6_9PLEO|nr:hypothetical protein B0J11DRAFT_320439 [Dendryphion nanum]
MRFFSLVAGAAFAAVALAQSTVNITNTAISPEAGKPFTITYLPATASVTVLLKNGPSGNLKTVSTIGTSSSGTVVWNVPANLPNEQYAFEIQPATGAPNYSGQFSVRGATAPVSSAASSSSSASTASSASSGSITRSTGSASTSASPTGGNSTISVPTLSTSTSGRPTASGSTTTTGSSPPQSTGGAAALAQSPLALILGAAAAMIYLA